ncbi:hypothetical protein M4578_18230 [Salipiger sp. P9]|uniref:hypothetical protein n=1 Tax=Salipiger pentaromativorans TaxID=2943193 RepID=UPI0021584188|nr:hypothetical protein [Salipiger pentaromativorans]MCR8549773.1 hypothetical protein [Salipiger pentaromativorans]
MGSLRIFLGGAVLALAAAAPPAAGPAQTVERAQLFADCAGRFSAEIEFTWLMQRGDGATDQTLRAGVEALLAAILPDARAAGLDGIALRHRRIAAKAAQARLRHGAQFGTDPRRATRARLLASRHRAACAALLPG